MKLGNPRFLFLMIWAGFSTSGFGQGISNSPGPALRESSAAVAKSVVVETIKSGSASEQAGMQVGDVLLRWTGGDAEVELESSFDLSWVGIEQAQRGTVENREPSWCREDGLALGSRESVSLSVPFLLNAFFVLGLKVKGWSW